MERRVLWTGSFFFYFSLSDVACFLFEVTQNPLFSFGAPPLNFCVVTTLFTAIFVSPPETGGLFPEQIFLAFPPPVYVPARWHSFPRQATPFFYGSGLVLYFARSAFHHSSPEIPVLSAVVFVANSAYPYPQSFLGPLTAFSVEGTRSGSRVTPIFVSARVPPPSSLLNSPPSSLRPYLRVPLARIAVSPLCAQSA